MRTLFASAFTLVAFTACAATDDAGTPTGSPAPAVASQAIINGSPDTSTPAAVFVYADNFGCTGSLFKVDRQRDLAWVLTAAHCVQDQSGNPVVPNGVVITTDYNTDPNLIFMQAIRAEHDPRYNGDDRYDVGVIT
ncbi:MAG: trypsin-like serine protease, partial [Proteobacteria bacterium]